MKDGHHTNPERILYNAVRTAYWLCEAEKQDEAYLVLSTALDTYKPQA